MEDKLVHSTVEIVNPHHCNKNGFQILPHLIQSMQHTSLEHVNLLKEELWKSQFDHLSWVLIKKELKIVKPLEKGERFTVLTYPSGFEKFFAYRDYLIFNADKKLVSAAASQWTLLDMNTRKISRIPEEILAVGLPKMAKFLKKPSNVDFKKSYEKVDQRKIRPYDLDWNDHVNNGILIKQFLEDLKLQGVEDHQIARLNMHFKNESRLGDKLDVFRCFNDGSYYYKSTSSEQEKLISQCKVSLF